MQRQPRATKAFYDGQASAELGPQKPVMWKSFGGRR